MPDQYQSLEPQDTIASNGGNGWRDGDEDPIVGAMRQLVHEQEQRLDAKVTQITREMRQTLEQFCCEHAAAEGMNQ